jgi:UDP-N-acetylmuramate: L-alanyl-gamma-D-glutamyl-meso-diaminopimelate ligase
MDISARGTTPKVHFIAIGGSVMHNLAIALHHKGYEVTGSDDEILEPSRGRLQQVGLLPPEIGWFPEKIHPGLEAVILGMHARMDNPELLRAQEFGIRIYSYPEYIYQQSVDKQRVVIAGSHGKTTITSMILHVLHFHGRKFDYLVGAKIEGFDTTVKLTEDAPIIIIEGDEYLSSPLDRQPKFLHYHHHIGLISGIAWDHINVYPTFEDYVRQFEEFADASPKGGVLIFDETDDLVAVICRKEREDVASMEYTMHKHVIRNGQTYLITPDSVEVPVRVFGEHNMKNISGARTVLARIGIGDRRFYEAIQSFKGAANRLELLGESPYTTIYKDFAHAPSKLEATTQAVREQFPNRQLIACLELHTFSSLNKTFLNQYRDTFNEADESIVYYNPHTLAHKRLENLSEEDVRAAFNNPNLRVFTDSQALKAMLLQHQWKDKNLLLMSSGNFNGLDMKQLASEVLAG